MRIELRFGEEMEVDFESQGGGCLSGYWLF